MGFIWKFFINFDYNYCFVEEEKRRCESAFSAVGFVYGDSTPTAGPAMDSNLSLPQHITTSSVDHREGGGFMPPPGLIIPDGIQVVSQVMVVQVAVALYA